MPVDPLVKSLLETLRAAGIAGRWRRDVSRECRRSFDVPGSRSPSACSLSARAVEWRGAAPAALAYVPLAL